MQNIAIILTLLLLPYWALIPAHVSEPLRGRIGLALVFAFTSVGHFIKTSTMTQLLPNWRPARVPVIYVRGIFELVAAVAILVPSMSRHTGIVLCILPLLILPSNVYAAFQRVDFGGHAAGSVYLLVRVPLQLFLIGWIYWFAARLPESAIRPQPRPTTPWRFGRLPWFHERNEFPLTQCSTNSTRIDASQSAITEQLYADTSDAAPLDDDSVEDDRLRLIFTCCHPALPPEARTALTLLEVCGLTTEDDLFSRHG
jgi:uncharacterized membrane protein